MSVYPNLVQLQRWMQWIITDPRGVTEALQNASESPSPNCCEVISETTEFDRIRRLDVYAEGYFLRLLDSLREDFERIEKIVGTGAFRELVLDYMARFPSRTTNIGEVGQSFFDYLVDETEKLRIPALPEVARMELMTQFVFWAENVPPFDPSSLSNVAPDDWGKIELTLNPSVHWMETFFPVQDLWIHEEIPQESFSALVKSWEALAEPRFLLFYRRDYVVFLRHIAAEEYYLLRLIGQGATLEELTSQFAEKYPEGHDNFGDFFQTWVEEGLIQSGNCR